jgi:hypothetical protein
MLAKIAHAFAAAEVGLSNFKPLLTDLILGHSNTPFHWIGGDSERAPNSKFDLHELGLATFRKGQTEYLIIGIRLFIPYRMPQYAVVTGELSRPRDQIPAFQNVSEA